MTRRGFLSRALVAATAPILSALTRPAAASEANRFRVAQVTTAGRPAIRTSAALVLGQEVRFRTAVDVRLDRISVPLGSRAIFELPFLLWVEEEPFPELDYREIANLATFVESGGFLLVDNAADGPALNAVDRRFRAELRRALPRRPLVPVPQTHVLLRSFYKLTSVAGRRAIRSFVEGAFIENRLGLVYSQNDLTGAWSRDAYGNWEFEAVPGGPAQREAALRFGVNVCMYALLLDYKDEQAHVDYLLRKRKLRPSDLGPRSP